jgi:tetratricopeptide (TPR) repeat protein
MREPLTRAAGLVLVVGYASFLGWLFAIQPKTMAEAVGGVAAGLGAYAVDSQAFSDGLSYFRNDQFAEARAAFARADPARRDARTQFYIAYSFYREGWHRTHRDDGLYQQGLAAVERAIEVAPGGRLVVDDANLQMHSADELKVELARGLGASVSDLNPLRLLESRK